MVQNVKTGRDVVMNFWLLDVVCNVVEEVCWYWQIIIFNHGHHYFHHVFPPCCQGSRCWWKTSWRTSQPPLQSVIGGGLKIEVCLISPSHVSKQIWLVQLSSSTAVPPTLHYFVMIIGTPPKSPQKRSNKMREEKEKKEKRDENWRLTTATNPTCFIMSTQLLCFLGTINSSTSSRAIQSYLWPKIQHDYSIDKIRQGVPEKTHFQNATERPRVKNPQWS